MHLTFIGAGFVGTTTAAAMASFGHTVLVYDLDDAKLAKLSSQDSKQIESCLYEAGLADLLIKYKDSITFTTDYSLVENAVNTTDAVFICVPTPHSDNGSTNMTYYDAALQSLATALAQRNDDAQTNHVLIINKSTVPIDAANHAQTILDNAGVQNVGVGGNPEFLVEGRAIEGSLNPSRIVVGANTEEDFAVFRQIYAQQRKNTDIPYIEVNPQEAAAGKLLANFLLFSRIANCYDVIGRTSETFDAVAFEALRKIITSDERLGFWGYYDSLYAGGSCLVKDSQSLAHQLAQKGGNTELIDDAVAANERQLARFLKRIKTESGCELSGATVALLGMAFKRETNDMRNSAGPRVLQWLIDQGVKQVNVYDPEVSGDEILALNDGPIEISQTAEDAITGTQLAIIATDWLEFKDLAKTFKAVVEPPYCIADGRRIIQEQYDDLAQKGYTIIAVGSTTQ